MSVNSIQHCIRPWPYIAILTLYTWGILSVVLMPSSSVFAQTIEPDEQYQRFIALYSQNNPSHEDLLLGLSLLENINKRSPNTAKYTRNLALANSILNDWDQAVRWFYQTLALTTDTNQSTRIQIEFNYSRLQQALRNTGQRSSQDSPVYSTPEYYVPLNAQLDLSSGQPEAMPQRISNRATRASHETPESILEKSLSRRHKLDTLLAQSLLLVVVDDESTALSHYENGIENIYSYLSNKYSTTIPQPQLITMIYPDAEALHSAARRIYPTLDLNSSSPLQGFYNPADHLLMATSEAGNYGVLIHELTHALLHADSPALPQWFSEAMALLYQNSQWRGDRLQPVMDQDTKTLPAESIPDLISLAEKIDGQVTDPGSSDTQLVLHFLHQNESLQSLQSTFQNRGPSFRFSDAVSELAIDESQWRQFLDLELIDISLATSADFKNNPVLIQYIQQALNWILDLNLQVDGIWGPATDRALTDFQLAEELAADGIPGTQTMQQLMLDHSFSSINLSP